MSTYYVATLASYVLVDAADECEARREGATALSRMNAERGSNAPVHVRTVRLATDDEIELLGWHEEQVAHEARQARR